MRSMAVARRGVARAVDGYLLRAEEEAVSRRTSAQQEAIERYHVGARRRMAAADALLEPAEALGSIILYREASILLLAAMAKAGDATAPFPSVPSEGWRLLDVAPDPRPAGKPARFDEARCVLAQDDTLAIDALSPAALLTLRIAAQEAVRWLSTRIDPRSVRVIRATRRLRAAVAVVAVIATLFFLGSAVFARPNVARGKPAFASSLCPSSPPAAG